MECQLCHKPLHKECAITDGGVFCDLCYITKEEGVPKVEFTIPDVIRRTYIETYRSCPYKFFKEVIEGHVPPPTCYTQIGIDLHEIFEEACKDRSYPASKAIQIMEQKFKEYDPALFDTGFETSKPEDMWKRTVDSIDTFFEKVLPTLPFTPFTTEETIEFSVGDDLPRVQFTMDRIDEVDGELEMHDWKTGKVMVGQKLSSDLQAPLYIYGTQKHFNKLVRSFTFYYLKENKIRVFTRTENPQIYECKVNKRSYYINLTDSIREIQRVFAQIKKGNFNVPQNTGKMYFTCKMCPYYADKTCEGADAQSWKQANGGGYSWT